MPDETSSDVTSASANSSSENSAQDKSIQDTETSARILLDLIQSFAQELQRSAQSIRVSLDTTFERELGFDSLAIAEMLLRVEKRFKVSLPQHLLSEIETPRDLLREVFQAQPQTEDSRAAREIVALELDKVEPTPASMKTLTEVLNWHVQAHPDRLHILLYEDKDKATEITYADLYKGAQKVSAGLLAKGMEAGQSVAIMLPTCRDYFECFWGILLAGCVPVPIYPPARPSQLEDHLRRHAGILSNAHSKLLLTVPEAKVAAQLLKAQVPNLREALTVDDIRQAGRELTGLDDFIAAPSISEDDTALLQYTSGSTGEPKGVILSHANLLANIRAIGHAMQVNENDVVVSWLPLYHDMGLIASWLSAVYFALPFVVMSPLLFLSDPSRWLWAIHRHRGTLSAAPNFAYELCMRQIKDEDLVGLDLSSWRGAFNGAEPVSPMTLRNFEQRYRAFGFRAEAMMPVYGLAESSVGLAIPPLGRPPRIDYVSRDALMLDGLAEPVAEADDHQGDEDSNALAFVSVGQPLMGHQIRIVDEKGGELPERREGQLEFKGPSTTDGYLHNAEATRALFDGEWLNSGDRAYLADGEVFITGRNKDIIIRAGRNLHPHQLEEKICAIKGIRKGCVAVFASQNNRQGTEQLVVLAETREVDEKIRAGLHQEIVDRCMNMTGSPPNDVVLAPPHTVPKTSSGKIRRAASRQLYEQGDLQQGQSRVWLQLLHLVLASIKPELRRGWRHLVELGYSAYCWLLFALIAPCTWMFVAASPLEKSNRSWSLACAAGKLLLRLSATRVRISGLENIPQENCVFVANHCSYLDALLLLVCLPEHVSFVAKQELKKSFFARVFLSRLNIRFVERFDFQKGVVDARNLAKSACAGQSLAFFPEGTFFRMPGLHPFRMGAFIAAVDAKVSVIPAVLRGTRSKLREGSWFIRRGELSVDFGLAIQPEGDDWNAAVQLRDQARRAVLLKCGEPDLAYSHRPL